MIVVGVLALLATACGSSTEEQFRASLIDEGVTEDQADCIISALEDAGINPESLTDQALGDNEPPAAAVEATLSCMFGGMLDDVDVDSSGLTGSGANTYGDDSALDALWDGCESGDGAACDSLYFQSDFGSEYEEYGNTCGGRFEAGAVSCAVELDG